MEIFHRYLIIVILKTLEETETESLYGSTHHMAKMFIKVARKHFPKYNKHHKIFNLNNIGNIFKQRKC